MGYMIQVSESKADRLREHAYKSMKHLGKLYECIEELCEESSFGEREGGSYGNRYSNRYGNRGSGGSYGNRMGERENWEDEDDMGERRGVPGSGRGRYRY